MQGTFHMISDLSIRDNGFLLEDYFDDTSNLMHRIESGSIAY
jgi:hypothetical protein